MNLILTLAALAAIPVDEHSHPLLGAKIPSELEYRNAMAKGVNYAKFAKNLKLALPTKVDISGRYIKPHEVGQQDQDCVGWAFAYAAKSYLEARERQRAPERPEDFFSPMFIYSLRPNRSAEAEEDRSGMNPLDAIKILEKVGCATWAMMPYEKNRLNDPPSDEIILKSFPYQVANYMILPPNSDSIRLMLANNQIVIVCVKVTQAFGNLRGNEVFRDWNLQDSRGGHALVVVGYDDDRRALRVMNSWGTKWADGGYGWVSYDLFDSDLPLKEAFCHFRGVLIEAPTVSFQATSAPADGQGYRWAVGLDGLPETLKEVLQVVYILPDPMKPVMVTRYDPDNRFALDSSALNPATVPGPFAMPVIIYTKSGFMLERKVFVPGTETAASHPRGGETVVVPREEGKDPAMAALRMLRLGLKPKISTIHKSLPSLGVMPKGKVYSQYPAPGSRTAKGGNVFLFVLDQTQP